MFTRPRLPAAALAFSTALIVAACGGAASPTGAPATPAATTAPTQAPTPEPTPSPTPAPTPQPTPEATPEPAPDAASMFAFDANDVLNYYASQGFECGDPNPDVIGFTIVQCTKAASKEPTAMISIAVSNDDGRTHYGYAGFYNKDGAKKPDKETAFQHLGGYLGALLGTEEGTVVGEWVYSNLGADLSDSYKGLQVFTYPLDDSPGSGYFIEVSTQDFLDAIRG